jgi:hypothetical protein
MDRLTSMSSFVQVANKRSFSCAARLLKLPASFLGLFRIGTRRRTQAGCRIDFTQLSMRLQCRDRARAASGYLSLS